MKALEEGPPQTIDDLDRSLPPRFDTRAVGVALCVVSAVGYSAANIFLREASETLNSFWVCCIKSVPTVIVAGLLVAYRARRGLPIFMSGRVFCVLMLSALTVQVIGNVTYQMSLGVIGLALTVPFTFGAMMICGAAMGRVWLAEVVTWRAIVSMGVLMVAIVVLSLGANDAHQSVETIDALPLDGTWLVVAGVALALTSGVCYAMLGAVIRKYVGSQVALSSMLLVISLTGLVSLGLITWAVADPGTIHDTTWQEWQSMLWAGIFNAIAFFALSKALHLISLIHVNLLNASQVAMAALAGTFLFGEKWTTALVLGVVLTVAGIVLMRRPGAKEATEI